MSAVVIAAASGEETVYVTGTGLNYDRDGYLVVVTGNDGDDAKPVAVWAPGHWLRGELREEP